MSVCTLSFDVRLATTREDVRDACAVRAQAYGHHMPDLAQRFGEPEALDHADGTAILLCRDKATGQAVGTARIQASTSGALILERSVILPHWLAGQTRAEITRLSVVSGADPMVKLCLMKASYLYCLASQIRWLVIGARNEALIRNYRRLGFKDLLNSDDMVPLAHAGGLPHRMLAFDVSAAQTTWHAERHSLYTFMVETSHPDLQLFPTSRPTLRPLKLVAAA